MEEIICLGLSHREAPVEVRERLALNASQQIEISTWLKKQEGIQGWVTLSTCNRIEFYSVMTTHSNPFTYLHGLFALLNENCENGLDQFWTRKGVRAVQHLFRVASGLESMVLGETEILGQLKQAYAQAHDLKLVNKTLHRLFQTAFQTGKKVRNQTDITRGSISVGSTAVELAAQIFGDLSHRKVVLLGAGETSEKTARALVARGIQAVIVANRTFDHAQELATELGGKAVPFENWDQELLEADIVISSTSAPHYVMTAEKCLPILEKRKARSLFLIDLAVPRDIDPILAQKDDVYLYNIDDLRSIADKNLAERQAAIQQGEKIIQEQVEHFMNWCQLAFPSDSPSLPQFSKVP
ncbi:MAG: glutamyl-tRNA reductase [Verrucomicrobiae bacterium]|nr:glutamyl-tRNA reductase [Verrucomicrobiae bacterium]